MCLCSRKVYECDTCRYRADSKLDLLEHINMVHDSEGARLLRNSARRSARKRFLYSSPKDK